MKKHKNDELRKLAMSAKLRFKQGFYTCPTEQRESMSNDSLENTKSISKITFQSFKTRVADSEQEKLYKRVCDLLEHDDDLTDPIGKLIDKEYFETLDARSKQKYIFELSAKFRELSERYYKERDKNMVENTKI
ncbi:MAG: hypothetical protein LBU60_03545 [Clostridiales bacterium]|jgi:hypothetical protein|nr:hypothetical protein [Clostridiales bacterium]